MSMAWTIGQPTLASVIIYGREKLNCWHCKTELIWGIDHDVSDEEDYYKMRTCLHCPNCGSDVDVWYPKENMNDET